MSLAFYNGGSVTYSGTYSDGNTPTEYIPGKWTDTSTEYIPGKWTEKTSDYPGKWAEWTGYPQPSYPQPSYPQPSYPQPSYPRPVTVPDIEDVEESVKKIFGIDDESQLTKSEPEPEHEPEPEIDESEYEVEEEEINIGDITDEW